MDKRQEKKETKKEPNNVKKVVKKQASKKDLITKDMTLDEAVSKFPKTAPVLFKFGLHCIGCHISAWETIEQGSLAHGLSPSDVDKMVKEMNEAAK
ncbi:MAG: DUF1858 domain-containing protein [archaeon]